VLLTRLLLQVSKRIEVTTIQVVFTNVLRLECAPIFRGEFRLNHILLPRDFACAIQHGDIGEDFNRLRLRSVHHHFKEVCIVLVRGGWADDVLANVLRFVFSFDRWDRCFSLLDVVPDHFLVWLAFWLGQKLRLAAHSTDSGWLGAAKLFAEIYLDRSVVARDLNLIVAEACLGYFALGHAALLSVVTDYLVDDVVNELSLAGHDFGCKGSGWLHLDDVDVE
jgi:hypothetical protein